MTIDQSQWDHSPGGFPQTLGHTNYAYSSTTSVANQGYDSSTLNSKQNSLDYSRDDLFSHISFLYANEKRFGDFHSLFRSVPDDEKLIEGNKKSHLHIPPPVWLQDRKKRGERNKSPSMVGCFCKTEGQKEITDNASWTNNNSDNS
jgi:hypothetical protein